MKPPLAKHTASLLLTALLAQPLAAAPEGPLKLPSFDALASKATHSVSITLDANLLGVAASFLDPSDPGDAAARELVGGLKGIYVRSYTFDNGFTYPSADVDSVRKQLAPPGWQQVMSVRGGKEHADVDIYLSMEHSKPNGLVIIASDPHQFTIVNIVGPIDLQKLRRLEGKLGVPKLPPGDAPPSQ